MKKILLIFLIFLTNCGYQPIYLNNSKIDLEYSEIILDGNGNINNKIISMLSIVENIEKENKNKFYLTSTFETKITSKNIDGKANSFRTILKVNLKIEDENKKILKEKIFDKQTTYNNEEKRIDLKEQQELIKDNLTNEVIEEIVLFLM
jgi:outer membrane lipopolysaccharide assembly protein LptE/RlpB